MNEPNILAFMQNPWFPEGTKPEIIDKYRTDQEFHQRLLVRTMSGGRLLQAFGPSMFSSIHWDNVAPTAAVEAAGKEDVDMEHVEKVISTIKPDVILVFGKHAEETLEDSIQRGEIPVLVCHHPNARGKTMGDLAQFAIEVCLWMDQWRLRQKDSPSQSIWRPQKLNLPGGSSEKK